MFIIIPNLHLIDNSTIRRIIAREGWYQGYRYIIGKHSQVHPVRGENAPNAHANPMPSNDSKLNIRERPLQPESTNHPEPAATEVQHAVEDVENILLPEQVERPDRVHTIQVCPAQVHDVPASESEEEDNDRDSSIVVSRFYLSVSDTTGKFSAILKVPNKNYKCLLLK